MFPHYPRPKLLDTIPLDGHAVIEASAGTGKTFAIEHMVVELLLRDKATLDQILVLTFTERAAAELRQRIRAKLEDIRFNPCEGVNCGHDVSRDVWRIDKTAIMLLDKALSAADAASIGTIHGFFGRVLAEHAFDSGQLFDGELVDGRALFGRAFKTALRRSFARLPGEPAELLGCWLEQVSDGIGGLEGLLFKCQSARSRILPPFSSDVLKNEIGASPLFNTDLIAQIEPFKAALKQAGVKHAGTLGAIATRLGVLSAKINDSGRSWTVTFDKDLQKALGEIREKIPKPSLGDRGAKALADAIVRLHGLLVSLEAAIVQTGLHEVRPALESLKNSTGQHDYDDLISGVNRALDSRRGDELIRSMRSRYSYALIDEFQDTDELQWSFFRRVFLDSENRNLLYLVGDPKQAIYGFRGADVATYFAASASVKQIEGRLVPLSKNFRSVSTLIDAYNHIFDQTARPPFFDGREILYDQPVEPGRELVVEPGDGSQHVPIHLLKFEPQGNGGGIGELRRGLAREIAREVSQILDANPRLEFGPEGETKPLEAREVFILTAKNTEAIEISRALREFDVPFAFYKQDGLFQTDEARQIRDLLAAIDAPEDRFLRGRAWITPFFAVPLEALPGLADLEVNHPLVHKLIEWKESASKRRFELLFSQVLNGSGVIRRELFLKDDERALTNYLHIFEVLLEEARATGCDLARLVGTLSAYILETSAPAGEDGNVQRLETDRDAVQIMTIHKSKGLEAAVVFVYGGFTGFPPDRLWQYHDEHGERVLYVGNSAEAKEASVREHKEERQRLYYVALTRAKVRLYLPYVESRHWGPRWDGGYHPVNERLIRIVEELPGSGKDHLFKVVPFQEQPQSAGGDEPIPTGPAIAAWRAPEDLLKPPDESSAYIGLRARHAGFEVTSYSRMKSASAAAAELVPLGREELERELEPSPVIAPPAEGELPGGTATGLMLHEILELVPFDSMNGLPSFDDWLALEHVKGVIDLALAHNTIDIRFRETAGAIVHRALRVEIPVRAGKSIPGFYQCKNHLREMEFLFPYPEDSHPGLLEGVAGKLVIERGFIKGYVDLVVEHDGLVYLADWKSDVLVSYGQEAVRRHVAEHYDLQAKLYALALVKALRVSKKTEYDARFGGVIYVFLRSPGQGDGPDSGVYFHRPLWSDILKYEKEIKQMNSRPWKGYP